MHQIHNYCLSRTSTDSKPFTASIAQDQML